MGEPIAPENDVRIPLSSDERFGPRCRWLEGCTGSLSLQEQSRLSPPAS
jgi:hypothetical protein